MSTIIAYFSPENIEKSENPFTCMDQLLIDYQYNIFTAERKAYELWFNLKYKSEDFRLNFFVRHCEEEPEYERFIADLRNKKGRIKSIFRPRNRKIALKKYDEFIRYKEKEYMNAIKETNARVEEILEDRVKFYDDLKETVKAIR